MSPEPLDRDRVLLGLLVAPALPGLALEVARCLHATQSPPGSGLLVCVASYLFSLLVGVPALGVFELRGLRSLRAYLLGGFVVLALIALPFLVLDRGEGRFTWPATALYAAMSGLTGSIVAGAFWWIAVRSRAAGGPRAERSIRHAA